MLFPNAAYNEPNMKRPLKPLTPLIPYVAVAIGLYWFSSAWIAIVSYHLGMLLAVCMGRDSRRKRVGRTSAWWYLSTIIFAMGGVIFYFLWPCIFHETAAIAARLQSFGIDSKLWPVFAIYFCCVNSLIEELFWRGYLQQDRRGLVLNDCAFGGYHAMVIAAFAGPIWCVPVFVACVFAGWLWRMMRQTTGSVIVPVLTHLVADATIVAAVHLRVFAR